MSGSKLLFPTANRSATDAVLDHCFGSCHVKQVRRSDPSRPPVGMVCFSDPVRAVKNLVSHVGHRCGPSKVIDVDAPVVSTVMRYLKTFRPCPMCKRANFGIDQVRGGDARVDDALCAALHASINERRNVCLDVAVPAEHDALVVLATHQRLELPGNATFNGARWHSPPPGVARSAKMKTVYLSTVCRSIVTRMTLVFRGLLWHNPNSNSTIVDWGTRV
jgi:hypothetical protein